METAMQETSQKYEFRVRWEPFLLRPNMPEDGVPKPPVTPGSARVSPHLKSAGESVGIDFTGKCDRYPNTVKSHALLDYAKAYKNGALQNQLQEALFQAYFTDGLYPDEANLLAIAAKSGLDVEGSKQALRDEQRLARVRDEAISWSAQGVSGVPMFYINDQSAFSGAQDVNTFVKMFDVVATKYPLPASQSAASL